ncbi:magnetosome protein MamC [Imhoffiella purpurea]|uniref:Uncharacterized protein n=1 Tax=Imhoffiella purpurea TaxID=1249627 RepID=W9W1I0_9GAMM|nr:magnetosome protein MamC [Imhoffiella purpurea]EXJ16460.1 hypothetical protein D779_0192 [Imhoffiella purpurea]
MSTYEEQRPYPLQPGAVYPHQQTYSGPSYGGPDCSALMRLATTGAIVGGTTAAAQQFRSLQSGMQTPQAALAETAKAAVTAGVATAAAGAVASSFAEQGIARLGLMFLVGTAVVYGIQARLSADEEES